MEINKLLILRNLIIIGLLAWGLDILPLLLFKEINDSSLEFQVIQFWFPYGVMISFGLMGLIIFYVHRRWFGERIPIRWVFLCVLISVSLAAFLPYIKMFASRPTSPNGDLLSIGFILIAPMTYLLFKVFALVCAFVIFLVCNRIYNHSTSHRSLEQKE